LTFRHPATGEVMTFASQLAADMAELLAKLEQM
jgi:hypothetical protein